MLKQAHWPSFPQSNLIVVFENVLIKAFRKRGTYCVLISAVALYGKPSSWFPRSKTYLFWLRFHLLWETFITGRFISSLLNALGDIFLMPLLMINILCNISSFNSCFHPWHAGEGVQRSTPSEAQHWHIHLGQVLHLVLNHLLDVECHHKYLVNNDYSWEIQG